MLLRGIQDPKPSTLYCQALCRFEFSLQLNVLEFRQQQKQPYVIGVIKGNTRSLDYRLFGLFGKERIEAELC